jgi:hypothetical protein
MGEQRESDGVGRSRHAVILRKASGTRPLLFRVRIAGADLVIKDFTPTPFLFRHLAGRFLVWREWKAYRRLGGVAGIPQCRGRLGGLMLALEFIHARDLETIHHQGLSLPEDFFTRLSALVEQCHRRGVAHCDLKRAPNTLLGADGRPWIVDWGAAICREEFPVFPLHRIYRRFMEDDRDAVTKLKLRFRPQCVSPAERERYARRSRPERLIRAARDRLRAWVQQTFSSSRPA